MHIRQIRIFRQSFQTLSKASQKAEAKGGGKAKGGTAKTAIKTQTQLKADLPPIPLFSLPQRESNFLKDATNIRPEHLNNTWTPTWNRPHEATLRSIDIDLQERLDTDGRFKLFDQNSPTRAPMGSILMVEFVTSRTQPRLQVHRRGAMTNFTLRHVVLKTGVEMKFPVFSPLILKIKVLKKADFRKDEKAMFENMNLDIIRENQKLLPIGFNKIDDMVLREREYTRKMLERTNSAK